MWADVSVCVGGGGRVRVGVGVGMGVGVDGWVPGIIQTYGTGRKPEDKTKGTFSAYFRETIGPNHKGTHRKGDSKGYEPQ